MNIFYEGHDITDIVKTNKCIVRDASGDHCDSLELEFENAAGWYSWGPKEDDRIVVTYSGYDSGIMFVNYILPEDGKYRILASSLPCKARKKEYASYYNKTIEEIMRDCAMKTNMDYKIYGIDGGTVIPYIERNYEGCGAFLSRLLMLEGAALKCINGVFTAIGYEYAQDRFAYQTVNLNATQRGASYRRTGETYRGITVKTPYACASAVDASVPDTHVFPTVNEPALTDVQAGRWARGKLRHVNMASEKVVLKTTFNQGISAMLRIDITGNTDANGEWIVECAEHDFINLNTTTTLRRCIRSITGGDNA